MNKLAQDGSGASIPAARTHAHGLARYLVKPLLNTPVRPNHMTALRLLTGLAAAAAFAAGSYLAVALGGLLFVLSALLDRVDGELARLGGFTSHFGNQFDLVSDITVNVIVFIGIGYGLREGLLGNWAVWLGLFAGGCIAAIFAIVLLLEKRGDTNIGLLQARSGFDPDDALFIVGPVALLNGLALLLLVAVIAAPLFLLYLLGEYRRA